MFWFDLDWVVVCLFCFGFVCDKILVLYSVVLVGMKIISIFFSVEIIDTNCYILFGILICRFIEYMCVIFINCILYYIILLLIYLCL